MALSILKARCSQTPLSPHAATIKSDSDAVWSTVFIFLLRTLGDSRPCALSSLGSVARKGERFVTCIQPNPHDLAKPMHRLMVGSSWFSSAVDGFNIRNMTALDDGAISRVRRYRYTPSLDITAPALCSLRVLIVVDEFLPSIASDVASALRIGSLLVKYGSTGASEHQTISYPGPDREER